MRSTGTGNLRTGCTVHHGSINSRKYRCTGRKNTAVSTRAFKVRPGGGAVAGDGLLRAVRPDGPPPGPGRRGGGGPAGLQRELGGALRGGRGLGWHPSALTSGH